MPTSRKPAATARVLIQNLESNPLRLQFSEFKIEYLHQSNRKGLVHAKEFFPEAVYGNSLLEWDFPDIPAAPIAPSGFGAIPFEAEDLLLLLRLYRPGDLAFVAMQLEGEGALSSTTIPLPSNFALGRRFHPAVRIQSGRRSSVGGVRA